MKKDKERIDRLRQYLEEESLDALICALPQNVLMVSGYWPMIGLSLAIITREGRVAVLAPKDEEELAQHGWAEELRTFSAASLDELRSSLEVVGQALAKFAPELGLRRGTKIGFESKDATVPVPYAALHGFGAATPGLLESAIPGAQLKAAADGLERLRAVLTPAEIERVRLACRIGAEAFRDGAGHLHPGLAETDAANHFHAPMHIAAKQLDPLERADGWAWCMSGPNSARAYGAFARTRSRRIEREDLVLMHSNCYAEGFWTDITRTFCFGEPGSRQRAMYEAVLAAFEAGIEVIKPGARAAAVDHAAREVLSARGFGKEFKHPAGHGAGFAAIDHNARPRLHPKSPDVLETGMVFNLEPAIYVEGYGGLRQCSMVAVTETGAEVLTPFQATLEELCLQA